MLQIELPQVNVLSKIDLAEKQGKLQFGLDFYTEVLDLSYLLEMMNADPFLRKHRELNARLVDVIENYSLVSFLPFSVTDHHLIRNVRAAIDKANGYIFGPGEDNQRHLVSLLSTAVGAQFQAEYAGAIGEKFLDSDEPSDECDDTMNMD